MDKIYRSCGNCKHWEKIAATLTIGECHLNPPSPLLNMDGDIIYVFPETLAAHKCGQFSENKSLEQIEGFETIRPYGQKADGQG